MTQLANRTKSLVPLMPLFEPGVAFAARTDLRQTRMIGFTSFALDSVTNVLLGLLNGMPTVRHICGVTDEGLAVLERAGLHVDEDMRTFETAAQAKRRTKELIEEGYKLALSAPCRDLSGKSPARLARPVAQAQQQEKPRRHRSGKAPAGPPHRSAR